LIARLRSAEQSDTAERRELDVVLNEGKQLDSVEIGS
jgi:hypothetical protein